MVVIVFFGCWGSAIIYNRCSDNGYWRSPSYKTGRLYCAPIGTPFIAGPGAITVTMLMSKNDALAVSIFPLMTIAAILFCLFATMVILYYSDKLLDLFGSEGNKAIARIMGIVIAAIGVEFIISGVLGVIGV